MQKDSLKVGAMLDQNVQIIQIVRDRIVTVVLMEDVFKIVHVPIDKPTVCRAHLVLHPRIQARLPRETPLDLASALPVMR